MQRLLSAVGDKYECGVFEGGPKPVPWGVCLLHQNRREFEPQHKRRPKRRFLREAANLVGYDHSDIAAYDDKRRRRELYESSEQRREEFWKVDEVAA